MSLLTQKRFDELTGKFKETHPIMVIGDIGIDKYSLGEVKRISPEAPVPIVEVYKEWHALGLAANTSLNLKKIGIDSTICGVIGDDPRASLIESLLEEGELKTWGIVRAKDRATTYKERVTTSTQQICRIDYETLGQLTPEAEESFNSRVDDFSEDHSAVIIVDYGKGALSPSIIKNSINKFKSAGKLVTIDPSRHTSPELYKGATLLKPNLNEAIEMVKQLGHETEDIEEMGNILIKELELEKVIITLGSKGMALIDTKGPCELQLIPTVARDIFDVSGAGDTAMSLITAALVAGGTLEEAAWLGNCGSGVVVGKKGTATVSLPELEEFYRELLISFKG
jgi:rfaE bifunctional protein kinase chain/domain